MTLSADHERAFYDRHYSAFLDVPDVDLFFDQATLRRELDDPSSPLYERRRLYANVLRVLLSADLSGKRVLDYGCGTGDWGTLMAGERAMVTFLDLSPAAVDVAMRRAKASGVSERASGVACDASDLRCFRDGEFDLVYANAAVHHTMKYEGAVQELVRILQPGGLLVLAENYGNNTVLNWLRRLRWRIAGESADQGEGVLLTDADLAAILRHFRSSDIQPVNLFAMAKRILRGRFESPFARAAMGALEAVDDLLFRVCPWLKRFSGEVVVVAWK